MIDGFIFNIKGTFITNNLEVEEKKANTVLSD